MKKFLYGVVSVLAVLAAWLGLCGTALAATASASVSISVSILLEGNKPEMPDSFVVKLAPNDGTAPMPEGAGDSLTIRGEGVGTFPRISYTKPGVYQYTIYQAAGTAACTYDSSKYYLTVTVVNGDAGLECIAILYQDNANNKLELPVFRNLYPTSSSEAGTAEPEPPESPAESENTDGTEEPEESETSDGTESEQGVSLSMPNSELLPTGVQDRWPLYAVGMVLLLVIAGAMIRVLRKEDDDES